MDDAGPDREASSSDPLRPNATIDEIRARVAHLSAAEPLVETVASASEPAEATDARSAKPRGRVLFAGIGGAGAIGIGIVIVLAKVGLKLFAVGVAAAALGGLFGDRYSQLPASQRVAFEQRYDAAIGSSLDGLSDEEQSARLQELVTHGASRLDDAALMSWARLDTKAHLATDVKTCATIARGWFVESTDQATIGAAVSKSYDALSIDDYGTLIDLDLKALEAERAGSPAVRSVSDTVMDPVFNGVYAAVGTVDRQTIAALASGTSASDDAACSALRGIDAAAAGLPADQFAYWAVWTSTP